MRSSLFLTLLILICPCLSQFQNDRIDFIIGHTIQQLDSMLQNLDPLFESTFVSIYHGSNSTERFTKMVKRQKGAYYLLVAKMYLYGVLDNPNHPELQSYKTQATYLAAYTFFKVASDSYSNAEAYYWLGLLEQFKIVPDRVIEGNLAKRTKNKVQQSLYKHLKISHLNNGQSNLFLSAALGFDPASLVLGHMNRQPFGTSMNCTASLAFYLAVLKRNLFQPYSPRLIADVSESLEDQLFSRKKIVKEEERNDHSFVMDTQYFDEETISATLQQANRFYTGSRGIRRDLRKALRLYEKLSEQGNSDGKVMTGLMYFRGEGTPRDVIKAKKYFEQTSKDEISEYMLMSMDYFQIITKNTRERALRTMKGKVSPKKKMGHLMEYLIGAVALKGQLNEVPYEEAVAMIDRSAADGNPSSRILMAILFSDGAKGLKYGCPEATRYLSEDAAYHPFFSNRINMAQVAMKQGKVTFAFFKYLQLVFNSFNTAFTNSLYLLQLYQDQALRFSPQSWQPSFLASSPNYKKLRSMGLLPDAYSYLLKTFSPVGTQPFTLNELDGLLLMSDDIKDQEIAYISKKIVKRGVVFEKRGMLKYYEYKLAKKEGASPRQIQTILSTLASGDSGKLYVLEARYLLGQLYHSNALASNLPIGQNQLRKIMGEYNRAIKSQLLGRFIYEIEQYRLTGLFQFVFADSDIGQDLLTYAFVLAIAIFTLYYLRSKRFDHFHRIELQKQLRRAQEDAPEQPGASEVNQPEESVAGLKEEEDPNQPLITEDPPIQSPPQVLGVRIGSSQEDHV